MYESEIDDSQEVAPRMRRKNPPAFPNGFRFGNINNETLVVDFVDATQDGDVTIFSSIVLSKSTAANLLKGLQGFLKNENE